MLSIPALHPQANISIPQASVGRGEAFFTPDGREGFFDGADGGAWANSSARVQLTGHEITPSGYMVGAQIPSTWMPECALQRLYLLLCPAEAVNY